MSEVKEYWIKKHPTNKNISNTIDLYTAVEERPQNSDWINVIEKSAYEAVREELIKMSLAPHVTMLQNASDQLVHNAEQLLKVIQENLLQKEEISKLRAEQVDAILERDSYKDNYNRLLLKWMREESEEISELQKELETVKNYSWTCESCGNNLMRVTHLELQEEMVKWRDEYFKKDSELATKEAELGITKVMLERKTLKYNQLADEYDLLVKSKEELENK